MAASLNPLRCDGTDLPVNLLLCAKLIALTLLVTNHVRLLTDPFLPFLPILDRIPHALFQRTVQVVFVASAVALLFNRRVRLSSLILGATILLSVVASKAYYGNNKTFCGCILFLTGLYQPGQKPWMLRWQLVIVYLGAGLNKLLDGDWRSGVFFENWAVRRLHQPVYMLISNWLPPMLLARVMSWMAIATELGMSVAFSVRTLYPYGIWASLLFHSGMLFFTGTTFTMFFYAMSAAMLVFVDWPTTPLTVVYDGDCGLCNSARRWMERFDLEGTFHWTPFPSGDAGDRVQLLDGDKIYSGYAAFKMMLLYNPAAYLITAAVLAAPRSAVSTFRMVVVAVLLALFLPPFDPVGQALYDLVARNRRRLSGKGACAVE